MYVGGIRRKVVKNTDFRAISGTTSVKVSPGCEKRSATTTVTRVATLSTVVLWEMGGTALVVSSTGENSRRVPETRFEPQTNRQHRKAQKSAG